MRSRAVNPGLGLEHIFRERSEGVYRLMVRRMVRYGRPVQFTLEEFRTWLRGQLGELMTVECEYCGRWLNVATYVVDHRDPLKFGGSSGIRNLALACAECNRLKGAMSVEGFRRLLMFAELHLHAKDVNEMFGRLKKGGAWHPPERKKREETLPFLTLS